MQPIFDNAQIKLHLLQGITEAQQSIEVAVAWFTDADLFAALVQAAQRGVRVCVLLHDDAINRNSGITWDVLITAGGALYWHAPFSGTMHHKFCVVDGMACYFGACNWTFAASSINRESILVIQDEKMAGSFRLELEKLLSDPCTSRHSGSAAYVLHTGVMAHQALEQLRAEIAMLELEIAALQEQLTEAETKLQRLEAILRAELADLLLEQIRLQQQLAEAKARLTMKRVYQEQAREWQEKYAQTEEQIRADRKLKAPELEPDRQEEMSRMYKEALFAIHPDRFADDPDRYEEATRLTQELIDAFKASDFERVRDIWRRVQEGWAFMADVLQSDDLDALTRYRDKLKNQRDALLAQLDALRQHEVLQAATQYPDFMEYVERCRMQLQNQINDLKVEIQTMAHA